MKWMRFRIRTNEESEDIIISTLSEIGLEGAQIEDHAPLTAAEREQMFSDDMTENEEDDGIAYLNFFAEIDDRQMLTVSGDDGEKIQKTPEEMQTAIRQQLDELKQYSDIGAGTISADITQDIDWINNWKQYFHKFYIDDVLVIPSWETLDENDKKKAKKVLHIDPGTAFGTGMHETTQLCVRQLRKYVNAETELLDVGTGSGVLSILALMFGAKHAVGTDLDTCTIPAVHENMLANGISDKQFELLIGNIIDEQVVRDQVGYAKYDIVVANILPVVLLPLTPLITGHLKKGGIYITSGIIADKEETVRKSHEEAGFEILEIHHQGEWVSITSRKN
ncbi:MAG: 50S ribosomal protein L11 methyltransferase [Butyrivibrio sp.]|nr:50S ribosomal protein L11 methyltransferase [Butyrivibrio sp.]